MVYLIIITVILFVIYRVAGSVGLKRVEYKRYFSEEGVVEGDTVLLIEEISNRFFIPLFRVDVDSYLSNDLRLAGWPPENSGMQLFTSRFYLPPYVCVKRTIELHCMKRGYYRLESVNIKGRQVKAEAVLYVYPGMLEYGSGNPMESEMQNTLQTERQLFQDPFSFSGIRDYRYGDTFRSINYKATAKTGVVKVNNRDFFAGRNIMIYIDFGQSNLKPLDTDVYTALMERALSYSADMVWNSISRGFSVGFAANCRTHGRGRHVRYPMGRGHNHYIEILKEMAIIRMSDGCSLLWLINQDLDALWNVDIYIMTANAAQILDDVSAIYRSRGNHVTILHLEGENELA